ncbi:MAG: NusG domain II-containing protein [Candidatus Latescibacterota bacterium]
MLTLWDKLLIGVLLLLGGLSFFVFSVFPGTGQMVIVAQNRELLARIPLANENTVRVNGPLGGTTIGITGGKARVVEASCPQKLCVKAGAIWKSGAMVVCVPNRVVVRIEGRAKEELDAVTR